MAEETKQQEGRFRNRQQDEVKVAAPGRVAKAIKAHHGKSTNADGSSFATPLKKGKTSGGDGSL